MIVIITDTIKTNNYTFFINVTDRSSPLACTNPLITEANIFPQKISITWNNIDIAFNGGDAVIFY
jgi:hypothetical protein